MRQATVDGGGRPATSTLDDVYGDGVESQKSARSYLVQDSQEEDQWEEEEVLDMDT